MSKFKQLNENGCTSMGVYGELQFGAYKSIYYSDNMLSVNRLMEVISPLALPIEVEQY